MCGIFAFIKTGKITFKFNIYQDYLNSPYITKRPQLLQEILKDDFQEYIIKNKLYVEFDPNSIAKLQNRGPDYQGYLEVNGSILYHSLLHMRGQADQYVKQPLQSDEFILQFNGEIYNLEPYASDTLFLFEKLKSINDYCKLPEFLRSLNGDYSFIFHDLRQQKIIFVKDPFGKKSLLLGFHEQGLILTSQSINDIQAQQDQDDEEEEDNAKVDEKYLLKKYINEFKQSQDKQLIEIPNNTIYTIDLREQICYSQKIFENLFQIIQPILLTPYDDLITNLRNKLFMSTKEIVQNIFGFQEHFYDKPIIKKGRIGILFSGGIDCSLIVHYVCKLLPPNSQIDLINVAFQKDAPDRITALSSFEELKQIHGNQNLQLVLIDKSMDDVYQNEKQFLSTLYPKITHMDFNIAMILNLASQYDKDTRVLLSGLGADEIFCGYARYKHAIKRGMDELLEEMNFDLLRLWIRNLGRDDRAVSQNAKELRFPFLNIDLINYARENIRPEWYQQGSTKSVLRDICKIEGLNKQSQESYIIWNQDSQTIQQEIFRRQQKSKRNCKLQYMKQINFIKNIVGSSNVITETFELLPYNVDWMRKYKGFSNLVVTPQNTEQISKLLHLFNEEGIKVVPQGGNTGLVGGGVPINDEVVISLKKMNRIKEYDINTRVITAESGCILADLNSYLTQYQSQIAWDLGARGSCQLGGNIATNAGGLNVVKNGLLRNYIIGLEAVLPNGTILDMMSKNRKDNTGLDFKQLFIGSEGTLGIITQANVLCIQSPKEKKVFLMELDSYQQIIDLLNDVKQNEFMSAFEFVEGKILCLKNTQIMDFKQNKYYAIIEFAGQKIDLDGICDNLVKHTEKVIYNQSEDEYKKIWHLRESIAETMGKMGYVFSNHIICVPPEKFEDFVHQIYPDRNNAPYNVFYGHVGDGNIHFNIVLKELEELHKEEERIEERMFQLVKSMGGSISAEHGIGQHKTKYMLLQKGSNVLSEIKKIKQLFDPNNIMNPGKMI